MQKFPFSILEVHDMYEDGDIKSAIAIVVIWISTILIAVSVGLHYLAPCYYSPWQWFVLTIVILISTAFIYLYRPWFIVQMERKSARLANDIEQRIKNNPDKDVVVIVQETTRSEVTKLQKMVVEHLVNMGVIVYKREMK